jgi:Domain of unknown function (DUF1735)
MKFIKLTTALLASVILLNSCLKDKGLATEFGSNADIVSVDIPDAAGEIVVQGVDVLPANETINSIRIRVSSAKPTTSDVVVTLALKPALVTAYNTAHGTNFLEPGGALNGYTLPDGLKVTIPAGKQEGFLRIAINKAPLGFDAYALGFEILPGAGFVVNKGFKEIIFAFLVKNKYDGDYLRRGFYFHPNTAVIGPYVDNVVVSTLGAIRCAAPHAVVGGWLLQFDVDQATNVLTNWGHNTVPTPQSGFLTVENPTATTYAWPTDPSLQPGMGGYNVATYNNTYDPGTKTFWLHYGHAVGGTGPSTWSRVIYDKLVRQ